MPKNYPRETVDGKQKAVSHIVWHDATGRWPTEDEVIHHIDNNPLNNSIENLVCLSASEHISLHKKSEENPNFIRRGHEHPMFGKFGEDHWSWKGDDASDHAKQCRVYRARRRTVV